MVMNSKRLFNVMALSLMLGSVTVPVCAMLPNNTNAAAVRQSRNGDTSKRVFIPTLYKNLGTIAKYTLLVSAGIFAYKWFAPIANDKCCINYYIGNELPECSAGIDSKLNFIAALGLGHYCYDWFKLGL